MGNVLLDDYKKGDPSESYQRWLEQNPDLVGMELLAENKLFKVCSYQFNGRYVVLKAFFKRDPTSLSDYFKAFDSLNRMTEKEKTIHIMPVKLVNSPSNQPFVVAYRQKMFQTLHDIITSKPTTSDLKKQWYIFQMINAVYTVHRKFNFYHGHIRTSNFLQTTYGFLTLTDFANYKPLYIFEDSEEGLPEFRLFYSSSINNCTLAPQKITQTLEFMSHHKPIERNPSKIFSNINFQQWVSKSPLSSIDEGLSMSESQGVKYRHQSVQSVKNDIDVLGSIKNLQDMDIFSLGCSILQVLRDGKPLLSYEGLIKFKKGQISLQGYIEEGCNNLGTIKQENRQILKNLLKRMLSLSPANRPNIAEVYEISKQTIDMNIYSVIWHCLQAFSTTSFYQPDMRIALIYSIIKFIQFQQRNKTSLDFQVSLPKCLQSFEALKVFKNLIKNKIIFISQIPPGSLLDKIMNSVEKQDQLDSEEEQLIMNDEEGDKRRQFFVPLKNKKISQLRTSINVLTKTQKFLCPPEWGRSMKALIEAKYKGTRLNAEDLQKNHFQDLLEFYKKNQYIREIKIRQKEEYYSNFTIIVRIIFSCIRGCKFVTSKLIGIEMLMMIGKQSNDGILLKRLLPYFLSLIDDNDSVLCRYAFNRLIDMFYEFIDPFSNEEQVKYYDMFMEKLINCIKTPRLRVTLFRRMKEIYQICQWLEVHIRTILSLKQSPPTNFRKVIDAIRSTFGSFTNLQVRELMVNIHDRMWPDMFEYFVSFLNMEKILGLEKSISIANLEDTQSHKRMIDIIDSCVQSGLDQNGLSLFYAIRYFTFRKIYSLNLINKIAPMVIHPHLWVRNQAKDYIQMCLIQNPPTRAFFLFREAFEPPFPLQIKDLQNDLLLPQPLDDNEVDFSKKLIKPVRKIGLSEKLFLEYLEKAKHPRMFPISKESDIEQWSSSAKNFLQNKSEPIDFSIFIKKTIIRLFQSNFLYYVGNSKSPYNPQLKEEQRKAIYAELNEVIKKSSKFSLNDGSISHEKKDFFLSLNTILNTNFQKLLTRFISEDKTNKIKISQSLYLIMEALYKFEQFQIKPTLKLGQYNLKPNELEKIRPKGTLLTQIYEHRDVITCLENIADKFLISGSNDGTLRVFNTRKMEMNITAESEAVYEIGNEGQERSKIQSIAAFENTYTIVAGTSKGQIRIFQIQRMRGKGIELNRSSRLDNNTQLLKYSIGGEISKLVTFKNQNKNQCFCFVTAEGVLGIQDIRSRTKTMTYNIGKERGIPRCLAYSPMGPSILIGTLDGYVLTYDIRCNLISNIRQLLVDQNPTSVTGIYESPYFSEGRPLFAYTYPSKNYEFAYFDIYKDEPQFPAEKLVSSIERNDIVSVPTMVNKTKEQNFKLCSNSLTQKIYYKQLSDFNRNFNILDHLSDPLTVKQAKIREVWMDRCKNRYNQIYSIYNKRSLPFVHHLPSGILTHINPTPGGQIRGKKNLTLLVDKMDNKEVNEIEKMTTARPSNSNIFTYQYEEGADYLTSSAIFSNMVAVGSWEPVIRIYK